MPIHEKAALGLAYQKAIANLRPAEVYERLHEIHRHLVAVEEHVVGRSAVKNLDSAEFKLRAFYTGQPVPKI